MQGRKWNDYKTQQGNTRTLSQSIVIKVLYKPAELPVVEH